MTNTQSSAAAHSAAGSCTACSIPKSGPLKPVLTVIIIPRTQQSLCLSPVSSITHSPYLQPHVLGIALAEPNSVSILYKGPDGRCITCAVPGSKTLSDITAPQILVQHSKTLLVMTASQPMVPQASGTSFMEQHQHSPAIQRYGTWCTCWCCCQVISLRPT